MRVAGYGGKVIVKYGVKIVPKKYSFISDAYLSFCPFNAAYVKLMHFVVFILDPSPNKIRILIIARVCTKDFQ